MSGRLTSLQECTWGVPKYVQLYGFSDHTFVVHQKYWYIMRLIIYHEEFIKIATCGYQTQVSSDSSHFSLTVTLPLTYDLLSSHVRIFRISQWRILYVCKTQISIQEIRIPSKCRDDFMDLLGLDLQFTSFKHPKLNSSSRCLSCFSLKKTCMQPFIKCKFDQICEYSAISTNKPPSSIRIMLLLLCRRAASKILLNKSSPNGLVIISVAIVGLDL